MLSQHLEDKLLYFPWVNDVTIYVDDGWYQIIWNMFDELNRLSIKPTIIDIHEKYGSMVVDYRWLKGCSPEVSTIINKYENLSETTCEECGCKGSIRDVGGWLTAYCASCFESAQAEQKEMMAVRKAKQESEFTGVCYSCGTKGAILRDLGNEVRIGYCDPCYEKVKLDVEERERRANEFFSSFNSLNGLHLSQQDE